MKKIIIAMAAVAAAFTMASCNKEQLVEPEKDITPTEGNYIVTASTEGALTKTALNGNDTEGYDVFWSEGDSFKIIDRLGDKVFTLIKGAGTTVGSFTGDVPSINGDYTAYYPASYDGSNWPVKQSYTEGNGIPYSPMKANVSCMRREISGGKVEFKNVGGILRLTVKGAAKVTSITVYTDDTPDITLDCGNGVDLNNTDGTVFHIAMPAGTHSGTSILFKDDNSKCCIKTLKSDLVINRSEITTASIKVDKWSNVSKAPEGALSGIFTVSAERKKVFFSKGNLYWSGRVYGFENNQYDINVAGHQSPFFWSNTAEYARGTEWNLDFNAPMSFFTNADEVTADQGFTANGQTGLWRTLSKDEWSYLINRNNGIGEATINGVKGVIIFPDEYDGQTDGLTSIPEGCVFLPAGRDGGVTALYWSSTSMLETSSYIPTAAALRYVDGAWPPSVVSDGMPEKHFVRLVTDVLDSPTPTFNVSFDANGHGIAPASIDVPYHTAITTKPTDPVVDGFTFWGWYKDKDCTVEWDFARDIVTSNITLYAKWHISGALFGTFTVNSSGKKVYFAKGNLWYGKTSEEAESATFNFEENQYDYRIAWSVYYKCNVRDDGHISHFMWSKNANVSLAVDYDDPSANYNDVFFTNATQTTPNPNFTVNGQKGLWRAISAEESFYLFNHHKHVWATINGVGGIIVFCDGYSGETEGEFTEIPKDCLFLPAAGYRFGSVISSVNNPSRVSNAGEKGEYFTSTGGGYNAANWATSLVSSITFNSSFLNPESFDGRAAASAVRLVVDVK